MSCRFLRDTQIRTEILAKLNERGRGRDGSVLAAESPTSGNPSLEMPQSEEVIPADPAPLGLAASAFQAFCAEVLKVPTRSRTRAPQTVPLPHCWVSQRLRSAKILSGSRSVLDLPFRETISCRILRSSSLRIRQYSEAQYTT